MWKCGITGAPVIFSRRDNTEKAEEAEEMWKYGITGAPVIFSRRDNTEKSEKAEEKWKCGITGDPVIFSRRDNTEKSEKAEETRKCGSAEMLEHRRYIPGATYREIGGNRGNRGSRPLPENI
jgi:hypothetical protein